MDGSKCLLSHSLLYDQWRDKRMDKCLMLIVMIYDSRTMNKKQQSNCHHCYVGCNDQCKDYYFTLNPTIIIPEDLGS